jgi:hypothetical protein
MIPLGVGLIVILLMFTMLAELQLLGSSIDLMNICLKRVVCVLHQVLYVNCLYLKHMGVFGCC